MHERDLHRWQTLIREHAAVQGGELPADVVDELAAHLADLQASAMGQGLSEDQARQRARDALEAASFAELSRRASGGPER